MQALVIKPAFTREKLFAKKCSDTELLTIRSLDPYLDLPTIHRWVNETYAIQFWQLNRSFQVLQTLYDSVLENPLAHSFIACMNDTPIAQLDAYSVHSEELGQHVQVNPGDTGIHLLMGPPKEMKRGWSTFVLKGVQEFYFAHPLAGDLYAEPDQENTHANRLANETGFQFIKTIPLSYKTANLYRLSRERYQTL
jgi:RimJ/RimL family protein N-acetyltransferase